MNRNDKLTDFGVSQVCRFARERAEDIDSKTSRWTIWRYYAALILGLVAIIAIVAIPLQLTGALLTGNSWWVLHAFQSFVVYVFAKPVSEWLFPEVMK